jgi:hypothetical protein
MSNVAEAIGKLTKIFADQPEKARTKNAQATAVIQDGLKFQVTGPGGEKVLTDMPAPMGGTACGPNNRGLLGLDERVSAGLLSLRTKLRIGAEGAAPAQLQELVVWAEAHSPVGCTIRQAPAATTHVEIV